MTRTYDSGLLSADVVTILERVSSLTPDQRSTATKLIAKQGVEIALQLAATDPANPDLAALQNQVKAWNGSVASTSQLARALWAVQRHYNRLSRIREPHPIGVGLEQARLLLSFGFVVDWDGSGGVCFPAEVSAITERFVRLIAAHGSSSADPFDTSELAAELSKL